MPIAAVPEYLGKDFSQSSPGLRFGMYLPLWGVNQRSQTLNWSTHDVSYEVRGQQQQEREVKIENKVSALKQACALHKSDKDIAKAMLQRQSHVFSNTPTEHTLRLVATSIAPFTTGLGNEHPLENGFAFLNPYGLPYLPGSGVKGVLRAAAHELANGDWGTSDWEHSKADLKRHEVSKRDDKEGGKSKYLFSASDIDVLFGSEAPNGENHLRGVLSFWDVIPQIKGDSLMVEIMTPHQSHYYQKAKNAPVISPHDSGSPIPISFLTVPPDSEFAFHVVCDSNRLEHLAHDLAANERWKVLLREAFKHAFNWLGFGAKTAVGYGAMESEDIRQQKLNEAKARESEAKERKKLQDAERQQENALPWVGARVKFNRANKTLSVEKDGQSAFAIQPKGEELLNTLPPEIRAKVMGNQFVKVIALVAEGVLVKVQA